MNSIETKRETFEKENYHVSDLVEEVKDEGESYPIGMLKGLKRLVKKKTLIITRKYLK